MRLGKRLPALLAVAALLAMLSVTAFAHDVPDPSRTGSISVTMHSGDTAVAGGSLTLYRVGEVQEENGDYRFAPTGNFADCGESFQDISAPELAERLAQYAEGLTGLTLPIDDEGRVTFPELELGLYLLVQEEAAEGYYNAAPFLVSVPYMENGTYRYAVDASPKVELEKAPEPTKPTEPPEPTLPQTGQLNWPVPVLVVLGLGLFAGGWILYFGGRKDGREE